MKIKKTTQKREVDYKADRDLGSLKKSFSFIERRKIKSWKAISIIAFVAGVMGSIIWLDSKGIHLGSRATGETAVLSLSPANISVRRGESFNLNVLLDTNNSNVVAARADVAYDSRYYTLTGWNTTNSVFSSGNTCIYNSKPCELVRESTSGNINTISFVLAKPAPGVETSSGKIATLNFEATDDSITNNITIRFNGVRNYADSDVILSGTGDDGPGTDILSSVERSNVVIDTSVAPEGLTSIYRLYNKRTGVHLYAKGESGRDAILNKWSDFVYTDNSPSFYASLTPMDGLTPIYRLYNKRTGVHLYAKGESGRDAILNKWSDFVYTDNSPSFYASLTPMDGLTPIYRLYNKRTGVHLYAKGESGRDAILNKWSDFVYTDNSPSFYANTSQ